MGRKKKHKDYYFDEKEEQALIRYNETDSQAEKNKIYNEILKEPFEKMIQSILRRYPTYLGNYTIEEVESFGLVHLLNQMVGFKPEMHKKAFSYLQTIVRNYFIDHSKKNFKNTKINLSYEDYKAEINEDLKFSYELENEENNINTLINITVNKIENYINENKNLKKNELMVGRAVINIFKNWELLFLENSPDGKYDKKISNKFAKNKILLLLKEQTNLTTKEIRIALKPFRDIYFNEKANFFN